MQRPSRPKREVHHLQATGGDDSMQTYAGTKSTCQMTKLLWRRKTSVGLQQDSSTPKEGPGHVRSPHMKGTTLVAS